LFLFVKGAREELDAARAALDDLGPAPDWWSEDELRFLERIVAVRSQLAAASVAASRIAASLERRALAEEMAGRLRELERRRDQVAEAVHALTLTIPPDVRVVSQRAAQMERAGLAPHVAGLIAGVFSADASQDPIDLDILLAHDARAAAEYLADGPAWARGVPVRTADAFLKAILSVRDAG
jgi:hypothetical protein